MTEINQKLLQLILSGKTTNEILDTLKITPKQLKNRLDSIKNSGYNLTHEISDDGQIRYEVLKAAAHPLQNTLNLKLVKDPNTFTAIVYSDFHIGHQLENIDRIYKIYEYANKENINIMINCGDIIDGCCDGQDEKTVKKQIEKLIKKHPYDENILNLICFGNHDYSALQQYGIDISKILCTERKDFISLGFSIGLLNIKTGQIVISHPVKHIKTHHHHTWPQNWLERKVILKGHGHHNFTKTAYKKCIIKVPTLSDLTYSEYSTAPGAIKITIELAENGQFDTVNIENLIVMDKVYTINYSKHKLAGCQKLLKEDKILVKKTKRLI